MANKNVKGKISNKPEEKPSNSDSTNGKIVREDLEIVPTDHVEASQTMKSDCHQCNKEISENNIPLQYSSCEYFFLPDCVSISQEARQFIDSYVSTGIRWSCAPRS